MPQYNAYRFGERWYGTFCSGSIWVARKSKRVHPWESEGAHLLLLFSEATIRADLLWVRGLLRRRNTNANEICCFLPVGFSRVSKHMMQLGKWLDVIFLLQVHGYCRLFICCSEAYLDWNDSPSSATGKSFFFFERLLNRRTYISLNSWQQPARFTYKTCINLFSIANDSDHTVTRVWHCTCLTGSCQKYLSFCQPSHCHILFIFFVCFYKAFGFAG